MTLGTPRLLLRRWRPEDLAPFAALNRDPSVMATLGEPLTRAQSDGLAAKADGWFDVLGFGLAAVERREDGAFLGFTGIGELPEGLPAAGEVEIGWRLARDAWGHGYATEAARAVAGHAFGALGLPSLVAITAVSNHRSRAVMERLGMTPELEFDHARVPEGSPLRPHVQYRLDAPQNG